MKNFNDTGNINDVDIKLKKQETKLHVKYGISFRKKKKKNALKKRNRKRYINILQLLVLGGSWFSPLGPLDHSVF